MSVLFLANRQIAAGKLRSCITATTIPIARVSQPYQGTCCMQRAAYVIEAPPIDVNGDARC